MSNVQEQKGSSEQGQRAHFKRCTHLLRDEIEQVKKGDHPAPQMIH
jgi:hypothetical protein